MSNTSAYPISTANTTGYLPILGNPSGFSTTETTTQILVRTPGTYSGMGINLQTNSVNLSSVFTFRKNAANGNQTITVSTATTGLFTDTTHTDAVVGGDLVAMIFVPGSGSTGTLKGTNFKAEFDTTTSTTLTSARLGNATNLTGVNLSGAAATYFYQPNGALTNVNITESVAQVLQLYSATFKNLAAYMATNARANTTSLRFRKNTANGNQLISIAATITGWFEDTTNTDTVVANDIVDYTVVNGTGTGNLICNALLVDYQTTTNPGTGHVGNGYFTTIPFNANTTNYVSIAARHGSDTIESRMQSEVNAAFTFKGLCVKVTANTITATSTLMFRKNTADTTLLNTIAASATGTFSDTTHTETVASGNDVNFKFAMGATGTSLSVAWINLFTEIAGVSTSIDMTPNKITLTNKFITKI